MKILRATPILYVDRIEPLLDFWVQRLGYKKTVEVPHGQRLGFAILEKDGQQVMLQTHESADADMPALAEEVKGTTVVQYIEVDSLDAALACLEGVKLLVEPRQTFYGMKEIVVKDPAGYLMVFAQKVETAGDPH